MEDQSESELRELVREWRVGDAPASLESRVLGSRHAWWHVLIHGYIKVPVPVVCGGKLVVQFLYTTCVHCQATARMLSTLEREFGPRGLQVIGVAFNPEAQRVDVIDDFVKTNHLAFPVGAATLDSALAYLRISVMERFVVPQIVVIDRRGMIRAQSQAQGSTELQDEAYLRRLLDGLLKNDTAKPSARSRR